MFSLLISCGTSGKSPVSFGLKCTSLLHKGMQLDNLEYYLSTLCSVLCRRSVSMLLVHAIWVSVIPELKYLRLKYSQTTVTILLQPPN